MLSSCWPGFMVSSFPLTPVKLSVLLQRECKSLATWELEGQCDDCRWKLKV
jgi:hypothetical protein